MHVPIDIVSNTHPQDINIYGIYNDCTTDDPEHSPVADDDDDVWFKYNDDYIRGSDDDAGNGGGGGGGGGIDSSRPLFTSSTIAQRRRHLRHFAPGALIPEMHGLSESEVVGRVSEHIKVSMLHSIPNYGAVRLQRRTAIDFIYRR